jgi:histidinol dehydrogenase
MGAPDAQGYRLGERVVAVDRAGIYVPAGTAPLVSTVIMAALVAVEAGVEDVVVATPARSGRVDPAILAACHEVGVRRVLAVGGAQAVAALALGTQSVAPVDVIAGPGGVWVTEAKRQLAGVVGLDGVAGPSEVVVVADDSAPVEAVAADLIAQAEHDPTAWPVLIAVGEATAHSVALAVARQVASLPRRDVASTALRGGARLVAPDVATAVAWASALAPEHLELAVRDAERFVEAVAAAGAIFLGGVPEALGDYVAGPSHVLPTAGAARFGAPLGAETFWRRMSIVAAAAGEAPWAGESGAVAARLARVEGLEGHARAVEARQSAWGDATGVGA